MTGRRSAILRVRSFRRLLQPFGVSGCTAVTMVREYWRCRTSRATRVPLQMLNTDAISDSDGALTAAVAMMALVVVAVVYPLAWSSRSGSRSPA
jgi:hypothetical protein